MVCLLSLSFLLPLTLPSFLFSTTRTSLTVLTVAVILQKVSVLVCCRQFSYSKATASSIIKLTLAAQAGSLIKTYLHIYNVAYSKIKSAEKSFLLKKMY